MSGFMCKLYSPCMHFTRAPSGRQGYRSCRRQCKSIGLQPVKIEALPKFLRLMLASIYGRAVRQKILETEHSSKCVLRGWHVTRLLAKVWQQDASLWSKVAHKS